MDLSHFSGLVWLVVIIVPILGVLIAWIIWRRRRTREFIEYLNTHPIIDHRAFFKAYRSSRVFQPIIEKEKPDVPFGRLFQAFSMRHGLHVLLQSQQSGSVSKNVKEWVIWRRQFLAEKF